MFKIGLKLWSNNIQYIPEALRLYKSDTFDYIEMFAKPGTAQEYLSHWKELKIPYIVHAAHYLTGLNLAKKEQEAENLRLFRESVLFADTLDARFIIMHPGIDGTLTETKRQLRNITDPRVLIENKPYYALMDDLICQGSTPEEIRSIRSEHPIGFCLDIGHAINAANAHKKDPVAFIRSFLEFSPAVIHIADGERTSLYDAHEHLGQGTFPLKEIIPLIPENTLVTIETNKDHTASLEDFVQDVEFIKRGQK